MRTAECHRFAKAAVGDVIESRGDGPLGIVHLRYEAGPVGPLRTGLLARERNQNDDEGRPRPSPGLRRPSWSRGR
jgi:hypothetical protein